METYKNRSLDFFLFSQDLRYHSCSYSSIILFNAEHSLSNSEATENPRSLSVLVFKHCVGGEGPWEVSLGLGELLQGACRHGCGTKSFSLLLDSKKKIKMQILK